MTYLRKNFKYCLSQIKLKNTTTYEINKIINSLKSKTSYGYDEISDKILKVSAPFILSPLTYTARGLSGYRARRRVADSRRPVLMAGLSLNFK